MNIPPNTDHFTLTLEARYSERLFRRTARMWRHAQAVGTMCTIIGGSAVLASVTVALPAEVAYLGGLLLSLVMAGGVATRPADKAAAADLEAKRYAQLLAQAPGMDAAALYATLEKARESDAPEIESLRNPAQNDVMREVGWLDKVVPLTQRERLVSALA